tara:strand:+ start:313 stop:1095 length:783 start_codon:yes stop_codon:yes gene_type:complete
MTSEAPKDNTHPADRITVEDVKASFNNHIRPQIFVRLFARPLAIYLTPIVYNAGVSANMVTVFRCLLNVFALSALASGNWYMALAFMAHVYLSLILDCLDGNIARMSRSVTYWGKFFDGFADKFLSLLTPAAAGIAFWHAADDMRVLIVGFFVTLLAVYAELTKSRLSHHREWMIRETGPLTTSEVQRQSGWICIENRTTSVVYNVTFLSPLLLLLPDGLVYFLWILLPVQGFGAVIAGAALLGQGWANMRRSRTSIHSS